MKKILLISGSPRKGNTEFILKEIFASLDGEKELVLLREKDLRRCQGCLHCDKRKACCIQDDMQDLYEKISKTDIFVFGTPNYYDNVSGLMKDFFDRLNPFYETDKLKDKSVVIVATGGGKLNNTEKMAKMISDTVVKLHSMRTAGIFCFQGLEMSDVRSDKNSNEKIAEIIKMINSL